MLKRKRDLIYIPTEHPFNGPMYWQIQIIGALSGQPTRSKRFLYNGKKVLPILDKLIEAQGFEEIDPPEPTELISVDQGSDYWKIFRLYKPEEENHLFFNSTFLAKIFTLSKDYLRLFNNYFGLEKLTPPNDFVTNLFELGKRGEILALLLFKKKRTETTIYRPGPMVKTFELEKGKITIQASLDAISVQEYMLNSLGEDHFQRVFHIVEVKTWCKDCPLPNSFTDVPDEYKMQIYFQMLVSGIPRAYLLIYDIESNRMVVFAIYQHKKEEDFKDILGWYLLQQFTMKNKKKTTKNTWMLPKVETLHYINGGLYFEC